MSCVQSAFEAAPTAAIRLYVRVDEIWLGGRDSNPDTVVQSHVSYRWTTSQYQSRLTLLENYSL